MILTDSTICTSTPELIRLKFLHGTNVRKGDIITYDKMKGIKFLVGNMEDDTFTCTICDGKQVKDIDLRFMLPMTKFFILNLSEQTCKNSFDNKNKKEASAIYHASYYSLREDYTSLDKVIKYLREGFERVKFNTIQSYKLGIIDINNSIKIHVSVEASKTDVKITKEQQEKCDKEFEEFFKEYKTINE